MQRPAQFGVLVVAISFVSAAPAWAEEASQLRFEFAQEMERLKQVA